MDVRSIDEAWLAERVAEVVSPTSSAEAERLRSMLEQHAWEFSRLRPDVESARLVEPRRGIRHDESASFLRAVESGFARVDAGGYVTLPGVRPKSPVGRYALLSKSGSGVSINLEYIVQIGATAELVLDHGWQGNDIDFERGEFDALAYGETNRPLLAMEAKARATGPDSLQKLVLDWLGFARSANPNLSGNAGNKWRELVRFCAAGPTKVWLVADGARWSLSASRTSEGSLVLLSANSPAKE